MPTRNRPLSLLALAAAAAAAISTAMGAATVTGTISHAYPQPMPVSFSPASGGPGTVITVNGRGFTGLTQVWIGAAKNSPIEVLSDSVVKVTVAAGATTAHLGFINPEHSWFTSEDFTVAAGTSQGIVSGTVNGPPSTEVALQGTSTQDVGVGAGGNYRFSDVAQGSYTLSPHVAGQVFTPSSVATKVGDAPVTHMNFAGRATTSPTYSIAGTVSGSGAVGAVVTLNGANVGSAMTNLGGNYGFSGLAAGTYSVSASLPGNTFSSSRIVTLGNVDSDSNNFTSGVAADSDIRVVAVGSLPAATVGKPYSTQVVQSVSGGSGAYRFQTGVYATGTPPIGMLLNANGTLSGTPDAAGTYGFVVCAADARGDVTRTCSPTSITVGSSTKPPPPPPPGTSWVYYNGVFDWPGDYSFVATPDYADTSGDPLSGPYDIKITLDGAWGGWLPYAKNWDFDSHGYTKLSFALKPTVANQVWHVYFVKVGDIPVGIYLDVSQYGPAPVPGQWATYTVPLADLGVLGTDIYKFCIQDQTGLSRNTWYVDNVGFAP